jgi:hypothetical protein
MARISTYALDTDITTNDKVIGTDSAGTITKNYKVSDLFGFLNKSGIVQGHGSRYTYVRPSGKTITYGYFESAVDQGATVAFSALSNIKIHRNTLADQNIDVSDFYEGIETSMVLIKQADDTSNFGVYVWNSSTQNSSDTSLYDINLTYKGGSGSLEVEKDYLLSLLVFRVDDLDKHKAVPQATPSATWSMNHGLNKKPSVTVVDANDNKVIGKVEYDDSNNVTIRFALPVSGIAYFN